MKQDTKHLILGLLLIVGVPLLLILVLTSIPLWAAVIAVAILLK